MDRGTASFLLEHAIEMVTRPFKSEKQTLRQREKGGLHAHLQRLAGAHQLKEEQREAEVHHHATMPPRHHAPRGAFLARGPVCSTSFCVSLVARFLL